MMATLKLSSQPSETNYITKNHLSHAIPKYLPQFSHVLIGASSPLHTAPPRGWLETIFIPFVLFLRLAIIRLSFNFIFTAFFPLDFNLSGKLTPLSSVPAELGGRWKKKKKVRFRWNEFLSVFTQTVEKRQEFHPPAGWSWSIFPIFTWNSIFTSRTPLSEDKKDLGVDFTLLV